MTIPSQQRHPEETTLARAYNYNRGDDALERALNRSIHAGKGEAALALLPGAAVPLNAWFTGSRIEGLN